MVYSVCSIKDLYKFTLLWRKPKEAEHGFTPSEDDFAFCGYILSNPDDFVVVAKGGKRLFGFVHAYESRVYGRPKSVVLESIHAVDEHMHKAFIKSVTDWARGRGVESVSIKAVNGSKFSDYMKGAGYVPVINVYNVPTKGGE